MKQKMVKKKLTKAEKELIEYADAKLHLGIKKKKKGQLDVLTTICITITVITIIIAITIFVLAQFSPFKDCERKDWNGTVEFPKGHIIDCKELLAVNTTLSEYVNEI